MGRISRINEVCDAFILFVLAEVSFAWRRLLNAKSLRIHGTGIFTYIYHKNQPNVGKYTSHMDPMGIDPGTCSHVINRGQVTIEVR